MAYELSDDAARAIVIEVLSREVVSLGERIDERVEGANTGKENIRNLMSAFDMLNCIINVLVYYGKDFEALETLTIKGK